MSGYEIKVKISDENSFVLTGKHGSNFKSFDEAKNAIKVFDEFYNCIHQEMVKRNEIIKPDYEICEIKGK